MILYGNVLDELINRNHGFDLISQKMQRDFIDAFRLSGLSFGDIHLT